MSVLNEAPCMFCHAAYNEDHSRTCPMYVATAVPNISGVKYDNGKPRPSLVLDSFANALDEISKVATFGALKYTDDGWVTVLNGEQRYKDALYRHLMAEAKGEPTDKESELLHLAHAAWNILAVLELKLRKE